MGASRGRIWNTRPGNAHHALIFADAYAELDDELGVEPVGLRPAMFPRYGDTRGMDHMRLVLRKYLIGLALTPVSN